MLDNSNPILLVESVSDLYGSSRIGRLVLGLMRDAGHTVDAVVAIERNAEADRYARVTKVPILVMRDFRRNPIRHLASVIRDTRCFSRELRGTYPRHGTVYCNTFATLPAAIVARRQGRHAIVHLHETAPGASVAFLFRTVVRALGIQVLAVSEAVRRSWGLGSMTQAHVVHNGIPDLAPTEEEARPCDILFVGRLAEKKGFHVLLDALRILDARTGPCLKVWIVGGPIPGEPLSPDAFAGFSRLDVEYLGERQDAPELFRRSKVACIPSLFADPFPTTVLEALRGGCLVVASEVGGVPEATKNTASVLVEPGRFDQLAEAIEAMLSEAERGTGSALNRSRYLERFTLDRFSERFKAVVEPNLPRR